MSSFLQRLGAFSVRRRRLVVGAWVLVLAGLGVATLVVNTKFSSTFKIPGSPSQKANDLLAQRLPQANGGSGRIVFAAPAGQKISPTQESAIRSTLAKTARTDGVLSVTDPFKSGTVSKAGRIAFAEVTFKKATGEVDKSTTNALANEGSTARHAGLTYALSGDAAPQAGGGGSAEAIGVVVALIVLIITFGAMLAAGMPLVTAVVGIGVGILGVTLIGSIVELSDTVTALASMLGLAVGIDYALFIISRHRQQAQGGMDIDASIARATGTAGSAVVFAGATVVIALSALAVTGVPFLTAMGLAAAGTVAIAVAISLTLTPALLGFAGARAIKGKANLAQTAEHDATDTMGGRWVRLIDRHRWPAMLAALVIPLALAMPALDLRLGLPDDSSAAKGSTQRASYELLKSGFGPGFSGPLTVVTEGGGTTTATKTAKTIIAEIKRLPDVASVADAAYSPDKSVGIVAVTPASGPSTAKTEDLVRSIRALNGDLDGGRVLVTGLTATNIDVSTRMRDSLVPYLAVVVGLALILLMVAFRSVLVPVSAVAGFLMTIAASLGALTAVFQNGFLSELFGVSTSGAPVVSLIPILMIGILFGLAMDYQVFLVSGMREERTHGAKPHEAVIQGFRRSSRVVTAAALIMISVFSGFIIPDDLIIKSIGFSLAFGVLIDAFLIRMVFIPALMSLLGDRAWWFPKWLDRIVPDVDIEGAKLEADRRARVEVAA